MKKTTQIALGVTGGVLIIGGGLFLTRRFSERRKLSAMLAESPIMNEARELGLIAWEPDEKAAELISLTGMSTADAVFPVLIVQVERMLPKESLQAPGVVAELAETVGVSPEQLAAFKAKAESIYAKLPDVPGVDLSSWWK